MLIMSVAPKGTPPPEAEAAPWLAASSPAAGAPASCVVVTDVSSAAADRSEAPTGASMCESPRAFFGLQHGCDTPFAPSGVPQLLTPLWHEITFSREKWGGDVINVIMTSDM
jgi:hypothetical protein